MNTYLDVGALRVQAYLTRSHRLRGRAGGSRHIAEVSRRFRAGAENAVLRELLGDGAADGWNFNPDAGAVDGVVSLWCRGTIPVEEVDQVAKRVLHHLRGHWPGAQLHAVWGVGEVYVDAYRDAIEPKLSRHEVMFSPPAADELPLSRPCQLCEQDAAVVRTWVVEEERELCPDCLQRGVHRGQGAEGERAMLLQELAERGDSTHLGTVFVDGNSVGRLFAGLRERDQRDRLSRALPAATGAALETATQRVLRDGEQPSEIRLVHVQGGDDLLVSVPADRAWRFARQLVTTFETVLATQLADLLEGDDADTGELAARLARATGGAVTCLPSAAAGVVIAHFLTPMATCVAAAQERLAEAKRRGAGQSSFVAWTDLTADGPSSPGWRRPWSLAELELAGPSLSRLTSVPPSARHAIVRLIATNRPALSWCRVAAYLNRLDRDDPIRVALQPLHAAVREADDPAPGMDRLLDAVTLARWW
jgi:hypothetical protein